jgi:hypothetical protein
LDSIDIGRLEVTETVRVFEVRGSAIAITETGA